ncbi:hypothetical protein HNY73_001936 [Argiope bruennichi]|uniref:Uncharacterized protein n=1 Tax=Argiope bruennichi TaxID=94029 RepID=A0A8T0FUG6_ARGBR|nr:hypothetical protein HNY73_001936 [Argiope bruennichi]
MELYSSVQSNTALKNSQCVFCDKNHFSADCRYAQSLPGDQRKDILRKKGGCFRCLKINHISSSCKSRIKCLNCGRLHHHLLCNNNQTQSPKEITKSKPVNDIPVEDQTLANVSSSPHVLLQTLVVHLRGEKDHVPEHLQGVAKKLKTSMYVDNCVTSLDSIEEVEAFIEHSKEIMMSAKFDLRGWRFNKDKSTFHRTGEKSPAHEENVSVLGLEWNPEDDTLRCAYKKDVFEAIPLTKRSILSSANQLFDPLGILSPVTVRFKILMQDCWRAKLSWDAELSDELAKKFLKLKRDLTYVDNLTIPRRLVINLKERNNLSFHVFCDASQLAYATCIYLRSENEEGVSCQLIQSRSRVAPLKPVTVSRLELLACTIGIRLMTTIKRDLHMEDRLYPLEVSSPINRELRKRIEDPVICDEGKGHNPSDSSSPVPVSQEIPAPVPVFQEATLPVPVSPEELLPTSQPRRINGYGRPLRAPHRLDL